MERIKHLVVGAGLSGAVVAQQIAEKKKEPVVVIERRPHLAGNAFDQPDLATRILVHQYGPHVFHTKDKAVWDYLSRFTEWHYFMYFVQAVIDGRLVNLPFNFDSLEKVFPRYLAEKLTQKLLLDRSNRILSKGYSLEPPVPVEGRFAPKKNCVSCFDF